MISTSSMPDLITLTARTPAGATRQYTLRADQGVFAGKSSNCGLQLPGTGIADIHCRIGFEEGKLYAQNWMSADGLRVNGRPISMKTEIAMGDVIQIGEHRILVEPGSRPTSASEIGQGESGRDDAAGVRRASATIAADAAEASSAPTPVVEPRESEIEDPSPSQTLARGNSAKQPHDSGDDSLQMDFFDFGDLLLEELSDAPLESHLRHRATSARSCEPHFDNSIVHLD